MPITSSSKSVMLEKEIKYYLEHQADLVKEYQGKYLIIKDQSVKGAFDNKEKAYFEGKDKFGLGSFLLQFCEPGNMFYNQTFFTQNVAFQ